VLEGEGTLVVVAVVLGGSIPTQNAGTSKLGTLCHGGPKLAKSGLRQFVLRATLCCKSKMHTR